MFEYQEKVLFEFLSFVDDPCISISLDFKFADGLVTDKTHNYVIDNEEALRVLVQDVRLVDSNGEVIQSMSPVWRKQSPFKLTFEFDRVQFDLGAMLPRNAEVRGKVAQNVPGLFALEISALSIDTSDHKLVRWIQRKVSAQLLKQILDGNPSMNLDSLDATFRQTAGRSGLHLP